MLVTEVTERYFVRIETESSDMQKKKNITNCVSRYSKQKIASENFSKSSPSVKKSRAPRVTIHLRKHNLFVFKGPNNC